MSAAQAVTATFAPIPQQTLSVSMAGNGSGSVVSDLAGIDCGEFCSAQFDSGGVVTLSADPAPGSRFAGWSGGGCSGTGDCMVTVAAGSSVTATFERIEHTIAVVTAGAGAGAISSAPGGISCGGTCSGRFFEGDTVTLTAIPATGAVFTGWSGPCSGRRGCTFTVTGDTTVQAEFRVAEWTLAVALGGEGLGTVNDPSANIHCGLTCSGVYLHGTSITLVAKPSPGSFFAGWHGCDRPEGATCHAIVDRDETVGAIFSISPKIVIGKVHNDKGGKAVTVTPSAPGTLSVRGKGLKKDKGRAAGAEEPVTLELDLSAAGRRALSKSKHGRLLIKAKVTFTPSDGDPPVTKTISVVFERER
jgi:Divergent InlB B-repeat domain